MAFEDELRDILSQYDLINKERNEVLIKVIRLVSSPSLVSAALKGGLSPFQPVEGSFPFPPHSDGIHKTL